MIYAVANTKGGVGKTTLAVHLATWLAKFGKTLLIDADKQASAASWAVWRRDRHIEPVADVIQLHDKSVLSNGRAITANYANSVIDVGGRDNVSLRGALLLADLCIVPLSHSDFDTAAWSDMANALLECAQGNPKLRAVAVLSRIDTRRKAPSDVYKFLEEQGMAVLNTLIGERVAYIHATNAGRTVWELKYDGRATSQVTAFIEEVISYGTGKAQSRES